MANVTPVLLEYLLQCRKEIQTIEMPEGAHPFTCYAGAEEPDHIILVTKINPANDKVPRRFVVVEGDGPIKLEIGRSIGTVFIKRKCVAWHVFEECGELRT